MQLAKHWAGQLDDYAIDLAWSPDGEKLAAASAAGPVSIFSAVDGTKQHELPGHDSGTNCVAWQPRLSMAGTAAEAGDNLPTLTLATGGQDGAVKFWDASAGQHTGTTQLGTAWVEYLAWHSQSKIHAPSGTAESGPIAAAKPALVFAAAGRTLAAIRADATVEHTFKPAPKTITALEPRPGGGSIAAAYFGGVVLWDADDFVIQKELPYGNGIHALVWSPDNRWLVSGNQDPSVHLWIPDEDVELHMSGYEGKVKFLSFDHTSRWLATSGGRDGCVWDCTGAGPEGREPAMLPHDAPVCAVKFQNSHGLLATAAKDGVVRLWSPERRSPLRATVKMPVAATKLAWTPDDRLLAIGSEKGAVYVLKCET
jgi:WD40 repeat protein